MIFYNLLEIPYKMISDDNHNSDKMYFIDLKEHNSSRKRKLIEKLEPLFYKLLMLRLKDL